jgi:hypothetical protein
VVEQGMDIGKIGRTLAAAIAEAAVGHGEARPR